MDFDELMIKRCIALAFNGLGNTYPNPMVGSVIVHRGKIIGEGWHQKAGQPHAEVNAINAVKDKQLLKEATLYVSLEPCSHFGKTPPCSDLIIRSQIPKVVIGITDPFEKVAGKGIEKLQNAGIEVVTNVLEKECYQLNKRFFTFHQKKRPYIFLKWAQTSDRFIAPKEREKIAPQWITGSFSRQFVHKMRSQEQAILVGKNTILHDNPMLNTRDWFGKNPVRVLIDRHLQTPADFSVFDKSQSTIFISEKKQNKTENIIFETIDFSKNMPQQVCALLYQKNIQSLIVEGGRAVLQQFIDANLWDEAYVFTGKTSFSEGIKTPDFQQVTLKEIRNFDNDFLHIYQNNL